MIYNGLSGTIWDAPEYVKPCHINGQSRTVADVNPTTDTTLDDVIAENMRRIRQVNGWNQGDLAEAMASVGWTPTTVTFIETGRRQVKATELIRLCVVLGVKPEDFLAGEGIYSFSADSHLHAGLEETRAALRRPRKAVVLDPSNDAVRDEERKMAKRLGMTGDLLRSLVQDVYGRSLTEERDSRLGDVSGLAARSVQAKRGRISTQITKELRAGLTTHAGGTVIIRDMGGDNR